MAAPAPARVVGIVLLVILVGTELVAVPEARLILRDSATVTVGGEPAGVRPPPSKWNKRRELGGEKRSVPGGPDPQHHY
ncbi:unnamed protein product [Urochloa humidicola]